MSSAARQGAVAEAPCVEQASPICLLAAFGHESRHHVAEGGFGEADLRERLLGELPDGLRDAPQGRLLRPAAPPDGSFRFSQFRAACPAFSQDIVVTRENGAGRLYGMGRTSTARKIVVLDMERFTVGILLLEERAVPDLQTFLRQAYVTISVQGDLDGIIAGFTFPVEGDGRVRESKTGAARAEAQARAQAAGPSETEARSHPAS